MVIEIAWWLVLGVGFGNVAMLGWLAAAAAPLLIHLWSRHRYREASWAAMQFLLAALRKNARRLQLQQWLLLALRTLLIALVVLAVAEPYGEQLNAGGASTPVHKVLVIDGSFSMAYRDDGASRLALAKQLAAEVVRRSRAGDSFTVILMAHPARVLVGRETIDHAAIAAQIASVTQTHTVADLPATFDLIENAVTETDNDGRAPMRQEIFFFTDLQRATWQTTETGGQFVNAEDSARSSQHRYDVQERLTALAAGATVIVLDVAGVDAGNLAVTRVEASEPLVAAARVMGIEVTLKQFSQEPLRECSVELLVDGVPVGQQTVDVPAAGEATVRFHHRFGSPGAHVLAVRAGRDQLTIDNSRWLVVPVREEIRVLCVEGREGAAKYVAAALRPNPESPSPIRPTIVSDGALSELEFADFDSIFLCNVPQLTVEEADRLRRYAAAGGGLVIFLGDGVLPLSYNAFAPGRLGRGAAQLPSGQQRGASLAPDSGHSAIDAAPPLLPARIGDSVSQRQFGLDPLDYRHPIVALFRGQERAGLLTTPVARYFRLDTSQSPREVRVAVATRAGDPLIVTGVVGRGRTALVATDSSLLSIDATTGEPWTIWPTWPSFLPIIRELVSFVGGGQYQAWQQQVGTPLHGTLTNLPTSPAVGDELQIVRPDGHTVGVAVETTSDGVYWSYGDTDVSGIYSLRGMLPGDAQPFAVNVDTAESDLAKADLQELPPEIVVRSAAQTPSDGGAGTVVSQAAWSGRLLWAALSIMFLESFLAWQFGRGSA